MRDYKRLRIRLKPRDRAAVSAVLSSGVQPVRTVFRALTLSQLHEGRSASEVAANVGITPKAVREIGRRYETRGLDGALYDKVRPGHAPLLTDPERQRIVAMVCSDPPEGRARLPPGSRGRGASYRMRRLACPPGARVRAPYRLPAGSRATARMDARRAARARGGRRGLGLGAR